MKHAQAVYKAEAPFAGVIGDTVTLDFDHRRRRRLKLKTDKGLDFLLDLPELKTLQDGDILLLEDGSAIGVRARNEAVADIRCNDLAHLVRVAWHLGNRHLPTELMGDRLRIRQDHVIEDMAAKLGATVTRLEAPFNPEGGAYGHGETEGHSHGHSHGHHHG
ncbi:urease accessory protein UreE [Sneathiella litorea]|uniref:Urease accessory protein UreE n=1 Tax=Sneathiella litorea TaxID=2606216 RepID=A0A6L8W475_9PROT|nr:urease accessory protein UreE [Sneathiella litorea]MZR29499.1 urease accessory protein UreE [Sneathiella litorea]